MCIYILYIYICIYENEYIIRYFVRVWFDKYPDMYMIGTHEAISANEFRGGYT